jgi:hypothetical protein
MIAYLEEHKTSWKDTSLRLLKWVGWETGSLVYQQHLGTGHQLQGRGAGGNEKLDAKILLPPP